VNKEGCFKNIGVDEFKATMRSIPGALSVITSQDGAVRNGMTATAVCSVSADPPQVLICVNASASVRVVIENAQHFAVNFLSTSRKKSQTFFLSSSLILTCASQWATGEAWRRDPRRLLALRRSWIVGW
jgi:flavin reductase (DIM6/NTAB) family NADH-FMN oxidoreductase RutF